MKKITIIIAAALLGLLCVPAGATTYLEAANSIMFKIQGHAVDLAFKLEQFH